MIFTSAVLLQEDATEGTWKDTSSKLNSSGITDSFEADM